MKPSITKFISLIFLVIALVLPFIIKNPYYLHLLILVYVNAILGMGFALMEEFTAGQTLSMKDYHIPTVADVPEIVPIIVESAEPSGPFGAKGVGEPALIPTAPAILNALADALGQRIYNLPANLERVLETSIQAGFFGRAQDLSVGDKKE